MDIRTGIRGAMITAAVVAATCIVIVIASAAVLDGFLSGFQTDADPLGQASGIVLPHLIPLFALIPLSFLYNCYEKGTRQRLLLKLLSVALLVLAIILLTDVVSYGADELGLDGASYIQIGTVQAYLDISQLRYVLLILPLLEIVLSIVEYRDGPDMHL